MRRKRSMSIWTRPTSSSQSLWSIVGTESICFLWELGRSLKSATKEPSSFAYLLQRLSVAIQVGNVSSVLEILPDTDISGNITCLSCLLSSRSLTTNECRWPHLPGNSRWTQCGTCNRPMQRLFIGGETFSNSPLARLVRTLSENRLASSPLMLKETLVSELP